MRSWFPHAPTVSVPEIEPEEALSYRDEIRTRVRSYAFGLDDWRAKVKTRRAYLRKVRDEDESEILRVYGALLTVAAAGPRPVRHLIAEGESAMAETALYALRHEDESAMSYPEERVLSDLYLWDVRVLERDLGLYAVHFSFPLIHRSPEGQKLKVLVWERASLEKVLKEVRSNRVLGVRVLDPSGWNDVWICPRCGATRRGGTGDLEQDHARRCSNCRGRMRKPDPNLLEMLKEPEGYLIMHFKTLARTFREDVRRLVVSDIESRDDVEDEELREFCLKLFPKVRKRLERVEKGAGGRFPPCIRELLRRAQEGENLPHEARFALAAFLVNVGWDVDRVVEVFSNLPDFDEERTQYQVRHIAGEVGGGTRYLPPNCDKMKAWGLCPGKDCGVKNPLAYYRRPRADDG
ncbi:DNA primase regulatory subunit PriL [Methanopyrus kandleri]|uniref:DNA primase large subunit PriL n=2 Tax=Methanopyrus kandleri TaxID=2320 RepID=PRIL_METKA|nr:DNA primase regulatory subunit PriL [Methanopyrus kandleri]Q8TVJ5.1 RecName: Full=DNA primase large subunit PriL [Methanopyrus kandleri AV19]AAM02607.1 Eukaryotic-type DNA primase, large subunit [Methanopyrus kandleri AV19]HII70277.1 DNA primase regulatory subunit PriL [Methanopyrus kandleri]